MLVPLPLDLSKVECSIFIFKFENLIVSYFWLLICWWYFSFPQRLSKNVRYSAHNVNTYVSIFSFSIKLLLGKNTFFMEYIWVTTSSRYPPEKLLIKLIKIPQKIPLKLGESLFNDVAEYIPETLQNPVLTSMFSNKL